MVRGDTSLQSLTKRIRFFLALAFLLAIPPSAYASSATKTIEPGLKAEITGGKRIYLRACPSEEYDASDWAPRVCEKPEKHKKYVVGDCIKVPFKELTKEYQLEVIKALFKDDSYDQSGWTHKVTYVSSRRRGGETLWNISEWFTGSGQNFKKILAHNGMSERAKLYKGTKINIPPSLLRPAFKEPIQLDIAARRAAEDPTKESNRLNGDLLLKADAQGPYASYRMKKGDTIYSKVVMKYTDMITAKDVMDAAKKICMRSGVQRAEKLRAGDEIKIPLDLLSAMYLPRDDPRKQEFDRLRQEAAKYTNPVKTTELRDILVVLDPGHGGIDPGAIGGDRIYEDELAYDIVCRIKRLLESTTMARVVSTMVDKSRQYKPNDNSYFPRDTDEYLLTTPVYRPQSSRTSANLRWYLANSLFRKAKNGGTNPDKVVFASFHADDLHPKARGTMVYIPGSYFCKGNGGKSGYVYASRAEVLEQQYVQIPYEERVRSEGLSREFAELLVRSLPRYDIRVHPGKPIRNHIIRERRQYVPAVIRHNIIPTKVLIEVVNLNNREDCRQAADPEFRERYARAFVYALKQYYGR